MNHLLRLTAAAALCCFTLGCTPPATDDVDVSMDTVETTEGETSNTTMGMETPDSNTTTVVEVPGGETP